MVVLKANAYGHGIEAVARRLAPLVDAIGVALLEEGITLRRWASRAPILVHRRDLVAAGPALPRARPELTVPSLARLRDVDEAAAAAARARVHLKIDTGMERIGVHRYNAERCSRRAARSRARGRRGRLLALRQRRRRRLAHARLQLERFQEVAALLRAPLAAVRRCVTSPTRRAVLRLPEATSTSCAPAPALRRLPVARRPRARRGASRRCRGGRASSTSRSSSRAAR